MTKKQFIGKVDGNERDYVRSNKAMVYKILLQKCFILSNVSMRYILQLCKII